MKKRVEKLQALIKDFDCLIVTAPEDIFYYTGYTPLEDDGSVLVVLERGARLFTTQNGFQTKTASVQITTMEKASDFIDFVKNYRIAGFDEDTLLSRSFLKLRKHIKLKPASGIIKQPRMIKDAKELAALRKAIALTKRAFKLKLSGTEAASAAEIDCFFKRNGAESAFPTIFASGTNSGNVHHRPGNRKRGNRDLVIVDIGAKINGYCADMSRTLCRSPGKREKKLIVTVKNIQEQLIDFIKPGMKLSEVQSEYEKLMKPNKVFHYFGHGVGLNIHEAPRKNDVLKENMIITVEPGIYIRNFGGCRIEDMVIIKKRAELIS